MEKASIRCQFSPYEAAYDAAFDKDVAPEDAAMAAVGQRRCFH